MSLTATMNLDQYTVDELFRKRLGVRRQLSAVEGLQPLRIAVLGGTTTHEGVDLLELFLLESGFKAVLHQSEYRRFYDDAVQDPADLIAFKPDIVYLHPSCLNVQPVPPVHCSEDEFE